MQGKSTGKMKVKYLPEWMSPLSPELHCEVFVLVGESARVVRARRIEEFVRQPPLT